MKDNDSIAILHKKFGNIYSQEKDAWIKLPSWAQFYLELGSILSTTSRIEERRFVIALAVPARAYVSVLVSAGVVVARAAKPSGFVQAAEHLRRLSSLEPGTPVLLRIQRRKFKGVFTRCVNSGEKVYFAIQTEIDNETTRHIPSTEAYRIEVLDVDDMRLPKHQKGQKLDTPCPLTESLLQTDAATKFYRRSQQDCALIGSRKALQEEMEHTLLALELENGMFAEGLLKDLLRPRQFLSKGAASRTYVVPANSQRVANFASSVEPYVTVFDGALSFLKWRDYWRTSNWIVVLDRTERNFEQAAERVNHEYIQKRVRNSRIPNIPVIPPAVEMMAYEELR